MNRVSKVCIIILTAWIIVVGMANTAVAGKKWTPTTEEAQIGHLEKHRIAGEHMAVGIAMCMGGFYREWAKASGSDNLGDVVIFALVFKLCGDNTMIH